MRTAGKWTIVGLLGLACAKDYELSAITAAEPDIDPATYMPCDFSVMDDARLSIYDCNPVFEATDEAWFDGGGGEMSVGAVGFYTNLVMGFPVYQIWYTARVADGSADDGTDFLAEWGVGTAVSENGADWDTHPDNPLLTEVGGAWDQDGINAIQIARDDRHDRYVMTYQGYVFDDGLLSVGVGVAESRDGIAWTRSPANPVLMQGVEYEGGMFMSWPLAIYVNEGGGVTSYMAANTGSEVIDMYAVEVSEDLGTWHVFDEPVLQAGPEVYDKAGITDASVVKLGEVYYMFYIGAGGWEDIIGGARTPVIQSLNLATSTTGINWTKHPDNPIAVTLTAEKELSGVAAQVVGDSIHLWVTDNYDETGDGKRSAVGYYLFRP